LISINLKDLDCSNAQNQQDARRFSSHARDEVKKFMQQ
jgi:hypothetical protein